MRGLWQDLTDLVLPAECGGCGKPRAVLCQECRAALYGAAPCRVRPVPEPLGLPVVHAAAPYEDEVRAALLAHKERGALSLAGPLGAALAGAVRAGLGYPWPVDPGRRPDAPDGRLRPGSGRLWAEGGRRGAGDRQGAGGGQSWLAESRAWSGGGRPWPRPVDRRVRSGVGQEWPAAGRPERAAVEGARDLVLLVPVPSSRRAVRARGHDPARRIALAAAGELRRSGTPARVLALLRQRRAVTDQSGLNSRQRLDNLAGALQVAAGYGRLLAEGGRVVLVDDLMTTGASLAEAARAVRAAMADGHAYAEGAGEARREATGERMAETTAAGVDGTRTAVDGTRTAVDRTHAARGMPHTGGVGDTIRAAVVAAPPDAFEINRN